MPTATNVKFDRRLFTQTLLGSAALGCAGALQGCSDSSTPQSTAKSNDRSMSMRDFVFGIPKAESHVHIPGCVTPELLLSLASRNQIDLPYESPEDVERFIAQSYGADLSAFVTVLDQIASVLKTGEDYYDTTYDYLARSASQNVKYVEASFGPQFAVGNQLALSEQLDGLNAARSSWLMASSSVSRWL